MGCPSRRQAAQLAASSRTIDRRRVAGCIFVCGGEGVAIFSSARRRIPRAKLPGSRGPHVTRGARCARAQPNDDGASHGATRPRRPRPRRRPRGRGRGVAGGAPRRPARARRHLLTLTLRDHAARRRRERRRLPRALDRALVVRAPRAGGGGRARVRRLAGPRLPRRARERGAARAAAALPLVARRALRRQRALRRRGVAARAARAAPAEADGAPRRQRRRQGEARAPRPRLRLRRQRPRRRRREPRRARDAPGGALHAAAQAARLVEGARARRRLGAGGLPPAPVGALHAPRRRVVRARAPARRRAARRRRRRRRGRGGVLALPRPARRRRRGGGRRHRRRRRPQRTARELQPRDGRRR